MSNSKEIQYLGLEEIGIIHNEKRNLWMWSSESYLAANKYYSPWEKDDSEGISRPQRTEPRAVENHSQGGSSGP